MNFIILTNIVYFIAGIVIGNILTDWSSKKIEENENEI